MHSWAAGYHYINLKNELNQPLLLPSLLVKTEAQDYIPNEHQGEGTTTPTMQLTLPQRACVQHPSSMSATVLLVLQAIVIIECLLFAKYLFSFFHSEPSIC